MAASDNLTTLPTPDTTTLNKAPLELVICQLRHERSQVPPTAAFALAVQGMLNDPYPNIGQPAPDLVIDPSRREISGGDPGGWHLKSDDGAWTVVLMPDFVALECVGYTRWSEFSRRMTDLLSAVDRERRPALMQRLGLRFVDRISRDETRVPREWAGYMADALLGFGVSEPVGPAVIATQTVHQISFDDVDVVLRSSCAPDTSVRPGYSMVLDTDAYDDRGRAFDLKDVTAMVDKLHLVSLQLFQLAVSDSLRAELAQ